MVHEHVSVHPTGLYPCACVHIAMWHTDPVPLHAGAWGATSQVASSFASGSRVNPARASGLQGGQDKAGETSERSAVVAKQPQGGWSRAGRGQGTPEGSGYQRDAVGLDAMLWGGLAEAEGSRRILRVGVEDGDCAMM